MDNQSSHLLRAFLLPPLGFSNSFKFIQNNQKLYNKEPLEVPEYSKRKHYFNHSTITFSVLVSEFLLILGYALTQYFYKRYIHNVIMWK